MQHKGQGGREGTHNTPGRTDVNARHTVVLIVNVIAVLVTVHRTSRECAGSRTVAVVEWLSSLSAFHNTWAGQVLGGGERQAVS